MPCYHPIQAFRSINANKNGKYPLIFKKDSPYANRNDSISVPCGNCIGCRLEYSRQWAIRCVHEAQVHEENSFLTLTYDDENIPENWSINKEDITKFFKRLRKRYEGKTIRYFQAGEYGDKTLRPHYHICLFGHDFEDKILWKKTEGGNLYTSEILKELWPFGYNVIGDVTFESAAYVARYIAKKINGKGAEHAYTRVDEETGEVFQVEPERATMSRRPGLGKVWYEKFKSDVFPKDFITIRGKKMFSPKYYTKNLESEDPELFEKIKSKRLLYAEDKEFDNSPNRLEVRKEVKEAQISFLKRTVD